MKTTAFATAAAILVVGAAVIGMLRGCRGMSESVLDDSAGMNGGFEVVRSGVPVNWIVYAPGTLPSGDFDLVIDTTERHEGRQSLKFVVRACSADGGWHSPGLSREFDATPGATCTVGFWAKSDGADFLATIGGVTATTIQRETIVRTSEPLAAWKHYEHAYTVPPGFNKVRFEVNVVGPGTFWLDDVTMSGVR